MSLIITPIETTIMLFFLIGINGFFCFFKMPLLAIPTALISIIFVLGFSINYTGTNIIFTLLALIFSVVSGYINYEDYRK